MSLLPIIGFTAVSVLWISNWATVLQGAVSIFLLLLWFIQDFVSFDSSVIPGPIVWRGLFCGLVSRSRYRFGSSTGPFCFAGPFPGLFFLGRETVLMGLFFDSTVNFESLFGGSTKSYFPISVKSNY